MPSDVSARGRRRSRQSLVDSQVKTFRVYFRVCPVLACSLDTLVTIRLCSIVIRKFRKLPFLSPSLSLCPARDFLRPRRPNELHRLCTLMYSLFSFIFFLRLFRNTCAMRKVSGSRVISNGVIKAIVSRQQNMYIIQLTQRATLQSPRGNRA